MNKQEAEAKQSSTTRTGERVNLDRQYGRIGISSVAAALPFVGKAKSSARPREDDSERRHSVLAV